MHTTRRMYVCFNCYTAYCHPLQHCYNCPGKLVARDYPYDWERSSNEQYAPGVFERWLETLGLKFGGI